MFKRSRLVLPAAVLAATAVVALMATGPNAIAAEDHGHGGGNGKLYVGNQKLPDGCKTRTGKTGNVGMAMHACMGAGVSDWHPNMSQLNAKDREIAFNMYKAILPWCIATPTLGVAKQKGFVSDGGDDSHYHREGVGNDRSDMDLYKYPTNPSSIVVAFDAGNAKGDNRRVSGIMYNEGWGLPHVGGAVRSHWHDDPQHAGDPDTLEMFHLWCADTIEGAFRWHEITNGAEVPTVAELKSALTKANTQGLAGVSTTLKGSKASTTDDKKTNDHVNSGASADENSSDKNSTTDEKSGAEKHDHSKSDSSTSATTSDEPTGAAKKDNSKGSNGATQKIPMGNIVMDDESPASDGTSDAGKSSATAEGTSNSSKKSKVKCQVSFSSAKATDNSVGLSGKCTGKGATSKSETLSFNLKCETLYTAQVVGNDAPKVKCSVGAGGSGSKVSDDASSDLICKVVLKHKEAGHLTLSGSCKKGSSSKTSGEDKAQNESESAASGSSSSSSSTSATSPSTTSTTTKVDNSAEHSGDNHGNHEHGTTSVSASNLAKNPQSIVLAHTDSTSEHDRSHATTTSTVVTEVEDQVLENNKDESALAFTGSSTLNGLALAMFLFGIGLGAISLKLYVRDRATSY